MSDEKRSPCADYAVVLRERREAKGRRVREVWMEWAAAQSDPKPSWLVPYDDLPECDKEADRMIGSALWGDGFHHGYNAGVEAAFKLLKGAQHSDGYPAT